MTVEESLAPSDETIAFLRRLFGLDKHPFNLDLRDLERGLHSNPIPERAEGIPTSESKAEQSHTEGISAPPPVQPATPWMTVQQVATYSGHHPDFIYDVLHEFEATRGRSGLRGFQRTVKAKWCIHRDDVDAWIRGERPPRCRPTAGS